MSQTVEDDVVHLFMQTGQLGAIEEHYRSGLLIISRGTAIILLFVYAAYLVFQLKTHAFLFKPRVRRNRESQEEGGDPEEGDREEEDREEEVLEMSPLIAGVALVSVTVVTSFAADYRE